MIGGMCRRLRAKGRPTPETGRSRLILAGTVIVAMFALIGLRVVELAALYEPEDRRRAIFAGGSGEYRPIRRNIVDRNGELLATSIYAESLSAKPHEIEDPDEVARQLVEILPNLDLEATRKKLAGKRRFVWIHRHLSPEQQYAVNRLGLPALEFHREIRRLYPKGDLAAHAVGFTDIDGRGLAGIERYYNEELAKGGDDLTLSIDIRAQHALLHELRLAVEKFSAIGAAGLIMDINTGEIIAMVSLPDFNPNRSRSVTQELQFNRTSLGVYEMGSTFKIFTIAMALEIASVDMEKQYDARKPIWINGHLIRDYHAKRRLLSVPEVFVYSSNIGSAKMAVEVGIDQHRAFMSRLGMLKRIDIELSEIGRPLFPSDWQPVSTMTIAFGHGLAVSPLHLIAGVAAVTNGGVYRSPTLRRRDPAEAESRGRRVVSARTSTHMRRLLRLVVAQGTGKKAAVPGYLVGGKTGTAEKQSGGRYQRKSLLSSFVGVFPIHKPKYAVLAMVDEAQGIPETFGYATGGWVAAPVVKQVIQRTAPILGVPPSKDLNRVQQAMAVSLDGKPLWREKKIAAH